LVAALSVWLVSVLCLFIGQSLAIGLYVFARYGNLTTHVLNRALKEDPIVILASLIAVIPAHLLTLLVAWAIVTNVGERPFWRALGWEWPARMGPWSSAALAVVLLIVGGVLSNLVGDRTTELDKIIASSLAARITVAVLATLTAPLVEEIVYRGVLYPALRRMIGRAGAVVLVSTLFASIHFAQYSDNWGVLLTIALLSFALTFVRAWTGRLLPCYFIHLVFNGLQAVFLIYSGTLPRS
jgi:membrane protease YdiL (CAAX protease family)